MSSPTRVWTAGAQHVGLNERHLIVEKFNAGSSNYVLALNEAGRTWAGAIRVPAPGTDPAEFIANKLQVLQTIDPLAEALGEGAPVNERCVLKFSGASSLIEAASTRAFLHAQSDRPFSVVDALSGFRKDLYAVGFDAQGEPVDPPHSYTEGSMSSDGPWFLSRGAPASETLEEFPELVLEVAQALGALHGTFPKRQPSSDVAVATIKIALRELRSRAQSWVPEYAASRKLRDRLTAGAWSRRPDLAQSEALLRSAAGRRLIAAVVAQEEPADADLGFVHGDAHGGNFIVVWFEFEADAMAAIDREFVNACFSRHMSASTLYYEINSETPFMARVQQMPGTRSIELVRRRHFEVHPIDLDEARFNSSEPQLVDLVTYAVSAANISEALVGQATEDSHLVEAYAAGRTGAMR